ncbi:PREDICTED: uncharacterized protein LOC106815587 [Priapulus caudatus]|uniref:Uncharacterized protein LOC106815587 n=1 Tax=Priapulus caudatus TaxID=37621 RepID=A0ABM1ETN0_PRICU|nr:PREDICTED: uncharacterized protein LOC106815587 [Priapulus caudatus]
MGSQAEQEGADKSKNRKKLVESEAEEVEERADKRKKPNPKKDGALYEMTRRYFDRNFLSRPFEDQPRGHLQEGKSGSFAPKTNDELSWRGMIRRVYISTIFAIPVQ